MLYTAQIGVVQKHGKKTTKNMKNKIIKAINSIISLFSNRPKLIRSWEELAKVPNSSTHRIEVFPNDRCAWIYPNDNKAIGYYLNSFTFREGYHKVATRKLRRKGFNIIICRSE